MTLTQQLITIGMVILGTVLTRFLPFLLFPAGRPTPRYVRYLGTVLPSAVFGLLVVYCLKDVSLFAGSRGIPPEAAGPPCPAIRADSRVKKAQLTPLYGMGKKRIPCGERRGLCLKIMFKRGSGPQALACLMAESTYRSSPPLLLPA